jgi:aminoglycoside phosphotransferase (APT) family kinase protein
LPSKPAERKRFPVNSADIARLEDWLAAEGLALGRVSNVTRLSGGTQNLLFRFRAGDKDFVLRRPAETARKGAGETIRREAVVLAALAQTQVPHPRFRGYCAEPAVLGAPFLVTDAVEGFNAAVAMPASARDDPAIRHAMGLATVDGIVALAGVDHVALGLENFGRLPDFIDRQVSRWARQLAGYAEHDEWPGPEALRGVERIGAWLDANRPVDWRGGLMHGDYHIANVLFRARDGALAAILDWELATLGDPLLDLGRLLAAWPDRDGQGPLSLKVEPWSGFPGRDELIARYAAGTGRSMRSLKWYEALACYKLAIILEGTHARACAGMADHGVGARLHAAAIALVARGNQAIERDG